MALTQQDVRIAWRQMLTIDPTLGQIFTKNDLDAALTAVDTWCTANQASFVAALPEPFKSGSIAQQKALALAYVALKRTGVI